MSTGCRELDFIRGKGQDLATSWKVSPPIDMEEAAMDLRALLFPGDIIVAQGGSWMPRFQVFPPLHCRL